MKAIADGTYHLWPMGGAWIAAVYRGGKLISTSQESDQATHDAANDNLAGLSPDDHDPEVSTDEADAIIRDVMGADQNPELIVVTKRP